jgi:hypothetical protein
MKWNENLLQKFEGITDRITFVLGGEHSSPFLAEVVKA